MMAVARPSAPRLSELLAGLATVEAAEDRPVFGLVLDSRSVRAGDCFLACPGLTGHGADYGREAARAGAAAIAVDADRVGIDLGGVDVPVVRVRDLPSQVGIIAGRFYAHPSRDLLVIGVTGTNGKTSVSHFLAHVLNGRGGPCGVIGTLGNGLVGQLQPAAMTTPDPITLQRLMAGMRDRRARSVVLEVSSHGLDQGRVSGVTFDVAAFTNLSRDHLDYHGTMDAYGKAKQRLFHQSGLGAAVLNLDDPFGREILSDMPAGVRVLGYTLMSNTEHLCRCVCGRGLRLTAQGLSMDIESPYGQGVLQSALLGRFNAYNLLAALAVLVEIGMPLEPALQGLSGVSGVPGRLERFGGGMGRPMVVVDYAHTPDGLQQALRAVRELCAGRLWCVFGCGGERDRGKRPQMGRVAEALADHVVLTWDNPRREDPAAIIDAILSGIGDPDRVRVVPDRAEAIALALSQAAPGDAVVVAGKGHEAYQEIAGQRYPFCDRDVVQGILGEN